MLICLHCRQAAYIRYRNIYNNNKYVYFFYMVALTILWSDRKKLKLLSKSKKCDQNLQWGCRECRGVYEWKFGKQCCLTAVVPPHILQSNCLFLCLHVHMREWILTDFTEPLCIIVCLSAISQKVREQAEQNKGMGGEERNNCNIV